MAVIKENVSLADLTTFKVGGRAKFLAVAKNEKEILEALNFSKENDLKVFFLGGGSNIVVSDNGFDGLVIKLENSSFQIVEKVLNFEAGKNLYDSVKEAARSGFSGFEWAAGIPGTFGGAIRGNAGAFGGEMSDNVESVRALNVEGLEIREFSKEECVFSYRSSFFKKNKQWLILSAKMRFSDGNKHEIEEKMVEIIKKRTEKQPQGFASAGSFFQNPEVDDEELVSRFERDIGSKSRAGKVAAGWLIEEAGLSGKRIGGAMISEKHANFLVNAGDAKADDIAMLSSYVKQQVRDKLGVQLLEEVEYVGF